LRKPLSARARPCALLAGFPCLLVAAAAALAAPASFTAQLDRDTVPLGESVTLTLSFEGFSPKGEPQLPALSNLTVTSSGQSSEFNIVNGQATSKISYNYTLVATQPGDVTIPMMQVVVEGKTLASPPLKLKVLHGTAAAAARPPSAVTNLAFLRLVVPKTQVYLGESFPVEIQLYWQSAQDVQMPQLKAAGFSLGQNAKPTQTRTQVGNAIYNLAAFKTSASAAQAGALTLGPAECSLTVLVPITTPRRRDPFDPFGFFNSSVQGRPTTLQSDAVTMRVLPLPTQGVPENFNGAVGSFSLSVTAGPTNLAVGDPITVKVQISGRGKLDGLTMPEQPAWREFKTYPPTSKLDLNDSLGFSGTKSFEQVVIPKNHEIRELPAFQFAYFDPDRKSYRTLSNAPIPLNVQASVAASVPPPGLTNAAAGADPPTPINDIIHIKARLEAAGPARPPLIQQGWFLLLQGVPVFTWLSLLATRKRRESLANNPRLRRQRNVAQRVRAGLQELRAAAGGQQAEEFFATLFRLLQEQIGERLDLPASAITEAVIEERLRGRNLAEGSLRALRELFHTCNQARYAPLKSSQELAALIPRAESVLRDLKNLKA